MSKLNEILSDVIGTDDDNFAIILNDEDKQVLVTEIKALFTTLVKKSYGEALDLDHMFEKLNEAIQEL